MALTDEAAAADRDGKLTLLFSLGAMRSLADPAAAVTDARRWSRYVGVVANDAAEVHTFCRTHGIDNDYALRSWDKAGLVQDLYEGIDTPRHVFVGTTAADRRVAIQAGWEYRPIEEAAERAGWDLGDPSVTTGADDGDDGLFARLRRWIRGRLR
ncbi:DUF7124 domain-containing protein [Halorubrum vacuolatum]|uniref:DUF7124 domain-containing protein n=1 Tax=Halorubrum vacuolatum TaxID=63740 RepID=A0A238XAX9_HALVU|nr:hypothetical protein [Halorubrum vacuolatum]SNR55870.1 hypothetical protein SAMN06264855_11544 [Halorubrum vacuolatum]